MKRWLFLVSAILIIIACSKNKYEFNPSANVPNDTCDVSNVSYKNDIVPLLNDTVRTGISDLYVNGCNNSYCHGNIRGTGVNFSYTTYDGLKEAAGSIYDRINRPSTDPLHMPEGNTIDPCNLYKLNVWIINGAPNN